MSTRTVKVHGLRDKEIPSCYLSSIKPSGDPEASVHQFTTPDGAYTGANYAQIALTYKDPSAASAAFNVLRTKISSCPKKKHIDSKRLSNDRVTLALDSTWRTESTTLLGWDHIRGEQTDKYPPTTSIISVYHIFFDYALRSNVILASVYWQRVKPSASGEPISKKATELLTKQLQKIG